MLQINEYVRASSLEEAYTLNQKKHNCVLGGMLWLKMTNRKVKTAIDLCDLGLDRIEEHAQYYEIGAMTTLRELETHEGLDALTQGALRDCLHSIVGVQFRNTATIGGSIYGRYGFSDILALLLALPTYVELYHRGIVSLEEYVNMPKDRDILVHIRIARKPLQVCYLSQRPAKTDFPTLTCAVARIEGNYQTAIGARPMRAALIKDCGIVDESMLEHSADLFAEYAAAQITTGSNMRGSAAYRMRLAKILVRRGCLSLMEVSDEN